MIVVIPFKENDYQATSLEELKQLVEQRYAGSGIRPVVRIDGESVVVEIPENQFQKAKADFAKAAELCGQGKFSRAESLLEAIRKDCPGFSEAHRLLAQIVMMNGDIDRAIDINLEALCSDPNNQWALLLMGNLLMQQSNMDAAKNYFERVLKIDTDNSIAMSNVGMCLIKSGKELDSLPYFEKSLKIDPTSPIPYYGKALAYSKRGKLEEAFEIARQGMLNSIDKPENPGQRANLQRLLISTAKHIVDEHDFTPIVQRYVSTVEAKTDLPIVFEKDSTLGVVAQMKMAQIHGTDKHVVVHRGNAEFEEHMILHEIVHLSMGLDALKNGKLKVHVSNAHHFARFKKHYERYFDKLEKKIGQDDTEHLAENLYSGLMLLILNSALDMFVEDEIFEMEAFRPMQMLSMLSLEENSIKGDAQGEENFPLELVNIVRTLNCATSLHLKKMYGIDMVMRHKPSKAVLNQAQDLFEEYEAYAEGYEAGEEYDLVQYYGDSVRCSNLFDLIDYVERDPAPSFGEQVEKQMLFDAQHGEDKNPAIDMMMTMYMLSALQYFGERLPSVAKDAAKQIAMIGMNGISPDKKSGYKVPAIPDEDFGGYRLLAYYYVSWAIAFPDLLPSLHLPFDSAFAAAKQLYEKGKKQ